MGVAQVEWELVIKAITGSRSPAMKNELANLYDLGIQFGRFDSRGKLSLEDPLLGQLPGDDVIIAANDLKIRRG